jgi:energy-coupling factor transporter ATP-binding protein EcfA2
MEKIKALLQGLRPELPITMIQLPDGHSMNDMWLNYGADGIQELLKNPTAQTQSTLEIINDFKIGFKGKTGLFYVIGQLPMDLGNLRISLQIIERETQKKTRLKIDLFDFVSVQNQCRELSEKQGFDINLLEADLIQLTDLLEQYRESLFDAEMNPITDKYSEKELTPKAHEKAMEFLSNKRLLENIDKLLEQSGIVGEEENRKLLFILASSYKMPYLLHALIQGTSGEGKSHLLNSIAECMPQEDVMNLTRITSKSLYHYREKELINKLILIQDFDGLDEEAQFAFREMQSAKFLSSSTVVKDMFGQTRGKMKQVQAHFSSLTATTKAEVYYDNMSRSVVLGVDESQEQTLRIIKQQNMKIAGISSAEGEQQAKQLLRNAMRVLKSFEVVNPFADKLMLPLEAKMLRRLNSQFQNFVSQITIMHQFQRKQDDKGRLIATKEDIKQAVEIFFSSIVIKVDELDKSTRQFFERLKGYVKSQPSGTTYRFCIREVRQDLNMSKTSANKYFQTLQELEYIQAVEGSVNKGFKYVIVYWDNMEKLKAKIKEDLNKQIQEL